MTDIIRHEELGGGYTMCPKIILDAADLRSIGKQYEVMALDHDGEELEAVTADDEAAAIKEFDRLVDKYAEPFQKALNAAGLVPGHRYTLVYLSEFGFPIADKITFYKAVSAHSRLSIRFAIYACIPPIIRL